MKNLVYLALDHEQFAREVTASVHSLFHIMGQRCEDYRIVIYTNLEAALRPLLGQDIAPRITVRVLSEEKAAQWLGGSQYVYRAKILALIDFMESSGESAIFIDSDTVFVSNADALFSRLAPDRFLMNYMEHRLIELIQGRKGEGRTRSVHRFFRDIFRVKKIGAGSRSYQITPDLGLWNSGIIGVHESGLSSLYEALGVSDAVFRRYRLRTAEQVALACVFQAHGVIEGGDDVVYHYWFLKEARYLVEQELGIASVVEEKHRDSVVMRGMEGGEDCAHQSLVQRIAFLTMEKWGSRLPTLLRVISPESNTGTALRQHRSRQARPQGVN